VIKCKNKNWLNKSIESNRWILNDPGLANDTCITINIVYDQGEVPFAPLSKRVPSLIITRMRQLENADSVRRQYIELPSNIESAVSLTDGPYMYVTSYSIFVY